MISRLRGEQGFGLIELLVSMTILNIGLLAIVADFSSSSLAIRRASRTATAAAIADRQLEIYRGLGWSSIGLDSASVTATDNTYRCDSTLGGSCPNSTTPLVVAGAPQCVAPLPASCLPTQAVAGPDRGNYRLDTYVTLVTPPSGRATKVVTVVVRENGNGSHLLARVVATFDLSN